MPSKFVAAIAFALLLQACASTAPAPESAPADPFLIVPGEKVGRVTRHTSEADLRRIYGNRRVKAYDVAVGEGIACKGTRISLGRGHSLAITWRDPESKSGALSVYVKGSRWQTKEGVRLGITLKQLERINRKPFLLTGFAWAYSGMVVGWNGGRLARYRVPRTRARIVVMLGPKQEDFKRIEEEGWYQVIGDRKVSSADPAMQELNPRAYALRVFLRPGKYCEPIKQD